MTLIDTHAHLDFPEFDSDRDQVIERAKAQGINYIVNIGSSLEGSRRSVELAAKYDCVYATVGIHPHEADSFESSQLDTLRGLARGRKVVAIGEIGLDYFRNFSLPERQRDLFQSLLGLAKELNLPIVIHARQADQDVLRTLKDFLPLKAVVHCFSGDAQFLNECLDLGFMVSYTCNITYKKAQGLREVLKVTPLDRLMLETDAPYLSPEGLRGKRNEPMHVLKLAEAVSQLKAITLDELADISSANARKFFKLN